MSKLQGRENDTVAVEPTAPKSEVAEREEAILEFWREHDIFNKSLEHPAGQEPKGDYVFYDGPPFATGLPHYGHILASTIKDAIPRFWTMQGYQVRRQWGWDCHGLPLENLIEKQLGLATKKDIETYGVKNFNEAARGAVMEYADEWKRIIPRLGRWADMENDYKTMDSTYTESVWWVFKQLHEKGLLFEGYKAMHLCPRCGTTLSNFEVNLGYKDIKDIAVFVMLPFVEPLLEAGEPQTSLVVWTTTPWTLPGNMAAAVHNDYEYAVVEKNDEETGEPMRFVVAKERVRAVFGEEGYQIVQTLKGSDLVGRSYEPPFDYWQQQEFEHKDNAWKIYHAEYVELGEEGTGAVHLAPAYGEEDMQLAKGYNIPIVHHVDDSGHFMSFVTDFAGQLVKPKDDDDAEVTHFDADIEVIKALSAWGRLFKKEKITHSYPHCWRCDTPLLNYATSSWFVNVPTIKDKLVAANQKVHWVPGHVGENRFGNWLEGAREWAVSRQRYWGAPIPIWRNPETKEYKVIGSLVELQQYVQKSGNRYFVMRHGQSESNLTGTIRTIPTVRDPLTEQGMTEARQAAEGLRGEKIDLIITSPFERTRETAEIVREVLGLAPEALVEDERLREINVGEALQGRKWNEYAALHGSFADEYTTHQEGVVENRRDVQRRAGDILYECEKKYEGKTILFVGHNSSMFALASASVGVEPEQAHELKQNFWLDNAAVREVPFVPMPHNDNYELDYHRPYIDDVALFENGVQLERVPDVFDCWFESGSMPYGQCHYPFENEVGFDGGRFPAQFIAEGLDQTRGWFYSLIVLGTALFGKSPYENVIVNGLVLAEDGKKMSKSLRNYPDPMELVDRVGADAVRFYLLSAPIMRAEDLNFSEKEVTELMRKNIGRLHNVLSMYHMYADSTAANGTSAHVLDRWIVARLNELVVESTTQYKNYELDKATRPLVDFIDDLSVWYLRRSRDRLKGSDEADKKLALGTLRFVLRELAKVMAPAMPFYAEYLYRSVREEEEAESVHLCAWPVAEMVTEDLLTDMSAARDIVTKALEARTKAGIKVRQPIASITGPLISEAMQQIITDEVNAKLYNVGEGVVIDTVITPVLQAEGVARELMRLVQDMRKQAGLEPQDSIVLMLDTDAAGQQLITQFADMIKKTVGARELTFAPVATEAVAVGEHHMGIQIEKV